MRTQVNVQRTVWYQGAWWSVVSRVNYWLTIEREVDGATVTKKIRPTKVF